MTVTLHHNDIPADLSFGKAVAVDSETMGLNPLRDRLCVVQLSAGDGTAHLVKFDGKDYSAPNLKKLLTDPNVEKLFHFGRFDIAVFWLYLGVLTQPVYCTKIASRLARTFSPHHSMKTICRELLGVDIDKQQQCSDWGAPELTAEQQVYAADDVLYLHALREKLDALLIREERIEFARAAFAYLPHRAVLDIAGWADVDIFAH